MGNLDNGIVKVQVDFIAEIKQKIRQAQYEALKAVNVQLIDIYWEIGKSIAEKQSESWGKAIVPTLSKELQTEFPGAGGFSEGNLWLMAQFYSEYHTVTNLVPLVREISWTKHIIIRTVVEYSLKSSNMPIGVATYTTSTNLPADYKALLPNSKEIGEKMNLYFNL
jgi:predicted nuclease of restriction endonuclease-like (RecB) superfamily